MMKKERKLTPYEKGFLEGMIEGEGSIIIYRPKNRIINIRLTISNTSLNLIQKIKNIIGSGYIQPKKDGSYEYRMSHRILRWLLPQLQFTIKEKEKRRLAALKSFKIRKLGINQFSPELYREDI